MLQAISQTNSYHSNPNSAVSQAVADAKPDLITQDLKLDQVVTSVKPPAKDQMTFSAELVNRTIDHKINKAIDDKIAEFFRKYPNGGTDQDVAQFLAGVSYPDI